MSNSFFKFKKFTIEQEHCAMKVGTDGCLLGAWFCTDDCKKILDVGSGSGLIALMAAQRSDAEVTGIEIEKEAAGQAAENVKNSPWKERVKIICDDFTRFSPPHTFDAIISNPPYFTNSLKCSSEKKTLARHNDTLSPEIFFKKSKELLSENGRISIVIPTDALPEWQLSATIAGFSTQRIALIHTTPKKAAKRVLAEFSRKVCNTPRTEDIILETSPGTYSERACELLRDFYLKIG